MAWPDPLTVTPAAPLHVAMGIPPSKNSMLPAEAGPEPGLVTDTVPVKVTDWPTTDGEPVVDTTAVVVAVAFAFCTTWMIAGEAAADAAKFVEPRYFAVME